MVDFFGDLRPEDIDQRTITKYLNKCMNEGKKTGTIRRGLGVLVACLNHCRKHKIISTDAMPYIPLPPQSQPRELFMDEQQEAEFYFQAMDHSKGQSALTSVSIYVALAMNTAARKSAICGLTWDRVGLVRKLIDYREPGRLVSKKRRVAVPINSRLLPILERAY